MTSARVHALSVRTAILCAAFACSALAAPHTAGASEHPTEANLYLAMSASAQSATVGDNVTYNIGVSNLGPGAAPGVKITDSLPAGTQLVSASASCTGAATIVCEAGTLDHAASASFQIVARLTAAGTVSNTASASSDAYDPYSANNSATATVTASRAPLKLDDIKLIGTPARDNVFGRGGDDRCGSGDNCDGGKRRGGDGQRRQRVYKLTVQFGLSAAAKVRAKVTPRTGKKGAKPRTRQRLFHEGRNTWRIALPEPLPPGVYLLTLDATGLGGEGDASASIDFTVRGKRRGRNATRTRG